MTIKQFLILQMSVNFIKCPADVKVEFNIQLTIYNLKIYYSMIINCVGIFFIPIKGQLLLQCKFRAFIEICLLESC